MKKILVIKNAKSQAKKIKSGFIKEKSFNITFQNECDGIELAYENYWDLIIIDADRLKRSISDICKTIRSYNSIPIIVLSDIQTSDACIESLQNGADDYIRKPFDKVELVERIKAILRRNSAHPHMNIHQYKFKDILIDEISKVVIQNDQVVHLTKREFGLLLTFIKNKNNILTREMLLNQVWGYELAVSPNIVDLYVGYLRKKLNFNNKNYYIETIHGRGYMLSD